MRILVADDEEAIRHVLFRILTREGHQVDLVQDGDELTKLWRKKHHTLIISDINMPGRNGIDVCQEIKKTNPRVQIVLMTGSSEWLEKAEMVGLGPCLKKPFTVSEVVARIANGHPQPHNFPISQK